MAYDLQLAGRIQRILAKRKGIIEKKMFGGIAFMLRGNMCCGVAKNTLMLRVGPEQYEKLLIDTLMKGRRSTAAEMET